MCIRDRIYRINVGSITSTRPAYICPYCAAAFCARIRFIRPTGMSLIHIYRQRANYYNFYADNEWGAADSYEVAINSGKLGVEKSIEVLAGICEHL